MIRLPSRRETVNRLIVLDLGSSHIFLMLTVVIESDLQFLLCCCYIWCAEERAHSQILLANRKGEEFCAFPYAIFSVHIHTYV